MKFDIKTWLAFGALVGCTFFFSSNAIFGRMAVDIEPFTLAFLRWSITGSILLVFSAREIQKLWATLCAHPRLFLALGWLGTWLAGGIVYMALKNTTASNGLLIYTLAPALVIVLEFLMKGRRSQPREWIGIAIAVIGVIWIMVEGDFQRLIELRFNRGDLLFLAAAIGWSFYTMGLRSTPVASLSTLGSLAVIALVGSLVLLPFMLWEVLDPSLAPFPSRIDQWVLISGIVASASLGAFILYNFGVRQVGPSIASIFMYLLAPVGLFQAWFFLGEQLSLAHWIGAAGVIFGVVLATLPVSSTAALSKPQNKAN